MMEGKKLQLSIIIPVYNVEKYLVECVESLYEQDVDISEFEVILINDGSTDRSYDIAKELADKHNNILLLTQDNSGQSVARNRGLDVAHGDYIMFVDSDDKLFPNVVRKILTIVEDNCLDVCAYQIRFEDESGILHDGAIQPFLSNMVYDGRYSITHGANFSAIWLNLYSRAMIENHHLRFLEGIYHQDVDFNLRMFAYANRIMFTDIVAYFYRFVAGSSTRKPNKTRFCKLIGDDFLVVRHIRDFSKQDEYGKKLKFFYCRHGNSIVISNILSLIRNKILDKEDKLQLFSQLKKLQLYPIKGRTLSWKTTLIIPFLNCEWMLKKMINWQ